ncbi:hypothetical protein L218DRAFT_374517 [Marasmius fiardii PR-910]|nr:hypothetical protein L218DRAFT_374517 [Marasmius fiardii PR-910]
MADTCQNQSSTPQIPVQDYRERISEDPLITPAVPRVKTANPSSPPSNVSSVISTTSSRSATSNLSVNSGWKSGVSLDDNTSANAYGDTTGTKGFGTGNQYEDGNRVNSIPGAYGASVGMKGLGTGNDYERSPRSSLSLSPRASPASSASSLRSRASRHLDMPTGDRLTEPEPGAEDESDKKWNKLGNKLLGAAQVVAGKVANNAKLVEKGHERQMIPA